MPPSPSLHPDCIRVIRTTEHPAQLPRIITRLDLRNRPVRAPHNQEARDQSKEHMAPIYQLLLPGPSPIFLVIVHPKARREQQAHGREEQRCFEGENVVEDRNRLREDKGENPDAGVAPYPG